MARLNRLGFVLIAVVFHLIYICSIFDIYFVSPIVSGMKEFGVEGVEPPARRLVLFVGDGLRADKAFQSFPDPSPPPSSTREEALTPRPLMPFLRSRVLSHGTFGVSHTRVPTESRPGHVALIAGLYEDVSAVTTGWKLNPVNFDSVFNRSRHTWSWGSPDILPMFKEGAVPGRVDAEVYGEEAEDFTQDATQLDTWVFDKVDAFFKSASANSTLNALLREDGLVFFLHLLGLDTTGHAYRPYSKEYLHNIKIVDRGVEQMTTLIENFYGDGKTAFVFTADHGMSDWGSHGDGHPDNTRTPLVAWGSGVAGPVTTDGEIAPGHEDGLSLDWGLHHVKRNDVAQADVAALMAYLAGLEFPVNSVGELPLSYLAGSLRQKAEAALVNTRGVLEMYRVKEEEKRSKKIRYQPFGSFEGNGTVESRTAKIEQLIRGESYEVAIAECAQLMKLGLQGLRYLQTYDWLFLRALVTAGYLGWIAFALVTVIDLHVLHGATDTLRTIPSTLFFSSLLMAIFSILWAQQSPWTYYAYALFPIVFWEEVFARRKAITEGRKVLLAQVHSVSDYVGLGFEAVVFVGLLQAIVQGYFRREIFTIIFLVAAFWPALYGRSFITKNKLLVAMWATACTVMSIFTLLPAIKVEDVNLIISGGVLMFIVGLFYLLYEERILTKSNGSAHESANGISRAILGAQPNTHYLHRLVVIFLSFSPIFILLTISYEGLFYVAFCATLLTWIRLEYRIYEHRTTETNVRSSEAPSGSSPVADTPGKQWRTLTLADVRVALFFFFLIQIAFFGTGNIASISSFSLDSVYRLIPVFNPFSQGALLVLKLLIPFAIISANLGILNRKVGVAPSALFMVVMAISDVLTLNFFYMVRDEGSWLDIGTTISHFCIASLLCVFVAILESISEVFISGVEVGDYTERSSSSAGKGVKRPERTIMNGNGSYNAHVDSAAPLSVKLANGHADGKESVLNGAAALS
ncbi:Glycosyl phosphatidyl inositol anchor synthesis [Trichoglossum hirsutum]|uniref:GPI ethanolamine phosphate transferase 1 n=1 Tax=Trichoglossum hirsutum TaxID=265104 RepID=A0A9P8LBH0_9PEZI|nr:Glycosyl phosphatidyl inositol anchor synthesis [Trichoglossum hirsutum]